MFCGLQLLIVLAPQTTLAREFPGMTYAGPSGLILAPNGQVLKHNNLGLGIHRGVAKVAYGLLGIVEAGGATPDLYDDPDLEDWKAGMIWFSKMSVSPAPRKWWIPSVALGAENSPDRSRETYYVVASWYRRLAGWPLEFTGGVGTGRFSRDGMDSGNDLLAAVGVIPESLLGNTVKMLAELAGPEAAVGMRLALSRTLRLDFAVLMRIQEPTGDEEAWRLNVSRGLPGASMASELGSLLRLVLPESKGHDGG